MTTETCANCGRSTVDWYHVGERFICGTCWDPFGELQQCLSPSEMPVSTDQECMMYGKPSRNSETPASCGNRTGGVADCKESAVSIVPSPPTHREPIRVGVLLPDVLAEMRRLQREAVR